MKKHNFLKKLAISVVLLLSISLTLMSGFTIKSKAFGDYNDYDYSYDYDSGSSWDDDDDSWGGGSSSSDGGFLIEIFFLLLRLCIKNPCLGCPLMTIFIIFLVVVVVKSKKDEDKKHVTHIDNNYLSRLEDEDDDKE